MEPKPTFLANPDHHLAEGEIDLGTSPEQPADQIVLFARLLLRAALQIDGRTLSSFTCELPAETPRGRLYGQAWVERPGTSVDFLRYRVLDDRARPVMVGMATSHRPGK